MEIAVTIAIVVGVLAALIAPVLRRGTAHSSDLNTALEGDVAAAGSVAIGDVEAEIARYGEALRANTLCARCGQANPADAKYCYECGRRLPVLDAEEFDGTEL